MRRGLNTRLSPGIWRKPAFFSKGCAGGTETEHNPAILKIVLRHMPGAPIALIPTFLRNRYNPAILKIVHIRICRGRELNSRPLAYEAIALTRLSYPGGII